MIITAQHDHHPSMIPKSLEACVCASISRSKRVNRDVGQGCEMTVGWGVHAISGVLLDEDQSRYSQLHHARIHARNGGAGILQALLCVSLLVLERSNGPFTSRSAIITNQCWNAWKFWLQIVECVPATLHALFSVGQRTLGCCLRRLNIFFVGGTKCFCALRYRTSIFWFL